MKMYILMCAGAISLGSHAMAQCERWFLVNASAPQGPSESQALVFHGGSRESVLFDAMQGPSGRQTWAWNGSIWRQIPGVQPTSGFGHAGAYDVGNQRIVLFGGVTSSFDLRETWTFDGTGWTQLFLDPRPNRRHYHAMAYDSRRGVTVMFGGSDGTNQFGDTWEFDSQAWRQVATTGPSPRYAHAMAYDASRGVTVLVGGLGTARYDDTWEWDGVSWRQIFGSSPGQTAQHVLVYDAHRGVCVLSRDPGPGASHNETWEWDGQVWTRVGVASPTRRVWSAATYDSDRRRIVLFGGQDVNGFPLGDTWEYGLYPDCDFSTGAGELDIFDFLCFLNKFAAQEPYACDCDTATGQGVCDVFDFLCFQNLFAGCP